MVRRKHSIQSAAAQKDTRIILVGAEDPLPSEHFWYEGSGYWIYAADKPRSAWREHTHECAQVTIGLEPAHVHAEWRTGTRAPAHRDRADPPVRGAGRSHAPHGRRQHTRCQRGEFRQRHF